MSRLFLDTRGNALIATLAILLGLTIVTTTYVLLATTETQISGHDTRTQQALYVAEAGVGEALGRLTSTAGANSILQAGAPTAGWGRYIVLSGGGSAADPARGAQATDGRDNDGDGQIDEAGEAYPEAITVQGASPLPYTWVKVRYKLNALGQIVLYGDTDHNPMTPNVENTTVGTPEYVITSSGTHGPASRVVEIVAPHDPLAAFPALIYTETTNFQFAGTQFEINGYDHDPVTGDSIPGAATLVGISTTGDPALITSQLKSQQQNNVIGAGGTPSVGHSPVDLDMQASFSAYTPYADRVYEAGQAPDPSTWGGLDEYHVIWCKGDCHLSGQGQGGGVLLVQGDLKISGQFTFYGAIICLGSIEFTGGGGGVHLWGAMMAANGVTTSEKYAGNAEIMYSSATLNRLNQFGPYRIAAWREI